MAEMMTAEQIAKYVDLDSALGRVRGNKNLVKRMLGMFLESEEINKLEEAIASGDNEQAANYSHAIKGVAGNLGLDPLFEISASLNQQFKEGNAAPEDITKYHEVLSNTIGAVKAQMEQL